jgi:hypothetical protein
MKTSIQPPMGHPPWNKGKLVGQKQLLLVTATWKAQCAISASKSRVTIIYWRHSVSDVSRRKAHHARKVTGISLDQLFRFGACRKTAASH